MFDKWKNRENPARPPLTILALMASDPDRELLRDICMDKGWKIVFARTLDEGVTLDAGIVICDRDLTESDWRAAIQQLAVAPEPRRVILASYVVDDYLWDEVIHCGGYDVLPKPFRAQEVVHTIQFAWAAVTKSHPSAPRTK